MRVRLTGRQEASWRKVENRPGKFSDQRSLTNFSPDFSFSARDLKSLGTPMGRKILKQVPAPTLARRERKRRLPRCFITRLLASHSFQWPFLRYLMVSGAVQKEHLSSEPTAQPLHLFSR